MVSTRKIRVGPRFLILRQKMKQETGLRFSDREFSDGLADFLEQEDLTTVMVRRAKRKRRGLF